MKGKQWYEILFEQNARQYDREVFTRGTAGECDFIEGELDFSKEGQILDVGCGTGRHAVELAARGYRVTGIDLSAAMLEQARLKAARQRLDIEFIQCDARNLPFDRRFDAAIMLCEGAFPLMETDEMNFQILQNVSRALKPAATFIFTTLNGLFPIRHSINDFHAGNDHREGARYHSETFDLMTFRDRNITTFTDDGGREHRLECSERYYLPSEITWLLKSLGFRQVDIFGARLGAFSRRDPLTPEDYEMLVIARRRE